MELSADTRWEVEADVVVVGSGAGALTAATVAADAGLEVALIERAPLLGGTTAVSGGVSWIPCNRWQAEAGLEDSRDAAHTYLFGLTQGREYDPELIETYLDRAPEAIAYLADNTPASFRVSGHYTDYFADREGGMEVSRSLILEPFAAREELGEWDELVRQSPHLPRITTDEIADATATNDPRNMGAVGDAVDTRAIIEGREREGIRVNGGSLVASLVKGLLDRGVEPWVETRARELISDGRTIVGVVAERRGEPTLLRARRGVVLACGGYEWNPDLVLAFLGVRGVKPNSPPNNEGDGLLMGMHAGGSVANMSVAWEYPVTATGEGTYEGAPVTTLANPRGEGGCILVNAGGRRFTNEAVAYQDLPKAFRAYDPVTQSYPNETAWLIFDREVRARVTVADLNPDGPTPSWVHEAPSLPELAAAIDVPAEALVATVERWNEHCEGGVDTDFGRGTVWYEGLTSGGPDPAAALARLEQAPFFAMPLYHGLNGTAGGLRVNSEAQVRRPDGKTIPGLYAVGSTAASIFGPMYPGAGGTIGQGICFGYLAGRSLAARS
jgi:succinate dehydrogenase/fumarate reductase flavoprotein subunit